MRSFETRHSIAGRGLILALAVVALGGIRALVAQDEGAMNNSPPYESNARIKSRHWAEDFTPDGDLEKEAWKKATWVRFDHDMTGRRNFPNAETSVAARWTAHHLYFAFRCRYSTLNVYQGEDAAEERWGLWNRDVVEVFVNPQPERVTHYYEFEVSPNNQWIDLEIDKTKTPFNDASWNSGFQHSTRLDARNHVWRCEMRIPSSSLGVKKILAGAEWRINFYRADGAGDDAQRRLMSWSTIPEGRTFHVPTRFGIIRFVK